MASPKDFHDDQFCAARIQQEKRKDNESSVDIDTLEVKKNFIALTMKNNLEEKKGSGDEGSSGIKGNKNKTQRRKIKRKGSESSSDIGDTLPENTLEVKKNIIALSVKNVHPEKMETGKLEVEKNIVASAVKNDHPENGTLEVQKKLKALAAKNVHPEKIETGTLEVKKNIIALSVKNVHPEKIETGKLEVEKNLVASAVKNDHPENGTLEVQKKLKALAVKNVHPEKIETGILEVEKNLVAPAVKNDHPEIGTLEVRKNLIALAVKNDTPERIKTCSLEVEKNLTASAVKNDHPEKIETGPLEVEKNLIALFVKNDHLEKNKIGTLEIEKNIIASAVKDDPPEKIETSTFEVEKDLIASAVKNYHPEKIKTVTLEVEKNLIASDVKDDLPEKIETSTLEVEKDLIASAVKNYHPKKIETVTLEVENNLIASAVKNDPPEKIETGTLEVEKKDSALKNYHPEKVETDDKGISGMKGNKYETRKIKRKESEKITDVEFNLPENTLEVDKNLIASVGKNNLGEKNEFGEEESSGNIYKTRGRKRKRKDSENSTDIEDMPENTLKVEKSLIVKNNLEEKNESGNEGSSGIKGNKYKTRGRKRKRKDSESSTDIEDILPENTQEVEKNLIASAVKNNLDDESVKRILKKVVTNEHVFALVKLREEEDEASDDKEVGLQPKFTRARVKELMKVSPNTTAWNIELTPIKHIPVKTRPEVKALIAQELPEDEDDEEYNPTHDDVPSDDDHTLESCSDIDSQPRTPATPGSTHTSSPRVRQDGPFKLPQELRTPVRKRLKLEEEPTIALRTRSKLSLSATSIEHIESSFIPPDDIPAPDVEDPVWNEFVNDILDPTSVSRVEDDDEADPEYNVAADPDAEEDEEALENTIVNISKKELNDLLTELMDIMPETTDNVNEELLIETGQSVVVWEGKREPESDEDTERCAELITLEKGDSATRLSVGKTEPQDPGYRDSTVNLQKEMAIQDKENIGEINTLNNRGAGNTSKNFIATKTPVKVHVEERIRNLPLPSRKVQAPAALRSLQKSQSEANVLHVEIDNNVKILPEQIQILQQQLRQHIQLCASNFLQLFVNPVHWKLAPCYKEYLMQLHSLVKSNPNSVVDVCNLDPAVELVDVWEKTASEDTPENKEMVKFVQDQAERNRRRYKQNSLYVGEFPEMIQRVIANSTVFLYPYLLPAMPYRADRVKKFGYRRCEDNLIALGLDMFWQYVESNPEIYKLHRHHPRARMGLLATCELMCKYMFPWLTPRMLILHVQRVRKEKDNPIYYFFKDRHIETVNHKLLPYNPNITLYEQPEHEVPRIWVRYLATSSKRFRDHLYKRKSSGLPPVEGVSVELGKSLEAPKKNPLPIDFTKEIVCTRRNLLPKPHNERIDKFDINLQTNVTNNAVNNVTQNIVVMDSEDGKGKVMVLGSLLPRKSIDITLTNSSPNANIIQDNTNNVLTDADVDATESYAEFTVVSDVNDSETENVTEVNQVTTNNNALAPQVYRLVETSTGGLLVPMNVETNTVNSINRPISTTKENINIRKNTNAAGTNTIENNYHCKCCILLKKICKGKQTTIKDFFKPSNNKQKPCECINKKYPKVSKRLQMLLENYKMNSWSVFRELNNKINAVYSEKENNEREDKTRTDDAYDLDDIAAVVTYQMKITTLTNNHRNYNTKTRLYNLFKNYQDAVKDPLYLAEEMYKICDVDLIELYKEFLGFLTVEQAVKINMFQDYFLQRCVKDIIKKVEQEVADKDVRHKILSQLDTVIRKMYLTSCGMCHSLLHTMDGFPKLAGYVFSLFPHRTVEMKEDSNSLQDFINTRQTEKQQAHPFTTTQNYPMTSIELNIVQQLSETETTKEITTQQQQVNPETNSMDHQMSTESQQRTDEVNLKDNRQLARELEEELDQAEDALTISEEPHKMDYEADHSSSEEDADNDIDKQSVAEQSELGYTTTQEHIFIKFESLPDEVPESNTKPPTDDNNEAAESDSTDKSNSMTIVVEEEAIKAEAPEWKREEDKLILEVLKQHLTPQDRKDKTILDIMEEKNLYQMLEESLTTKSSADIKDRVIYLLEILVRNDY